MEIETETRTATKENIITPLIRALKDSGVTKETVVEDLKNAPQYYVAIGNENEDYLKSSKLPREIAEIALEAFRSGMKVYMAKWCAADNKAQEYEDKYKKLAMKMADFIVKED